MSEHLSINLTKQLQNLYAKKPTKLTKEIQKDLKKLSHILCSWIGSFNIVNVSYFPFDL